MNKLSLLVGLAVVSASTAGCGCCGWLHHRPTPVTVAQPVCPPPPPVCDPCATAPITYGPAPGAIVPYTPPPSW